MQTDEFNLPDNSKTGVANEGEANPVPCPIPECSRYAAVSTLSEGFVVCPRHKVLRAFEAPCEACGGKQVQVYGGPGRGTRLGCLYCSSADDLDLLFPDA